MWGEGSPLPHYGFNVLLLNALDKALLSGRRPFKLLKKKMLMYMYVC